MANLSEAVTAAISAHVAWKTHLSAAICSGESGSQVGDAARDDLCAFGRWLMGDASLRVAALYPEVLALHARFHLEADRVLAIALQGRAEEAGAAMERGSAFDEASSALVRTLTAWRAAG
jgi:hypothetical protein